MTLKGAIRELLPPGIVRGWRQRSQVVKFSGDFPTWSEAARHATGYDQSGILQRVADATRKVVRGEAAYERDSVAFDRIEYSWPLLASLLQVALERHSLRVIDFGGSLGSTFRQNRVFLRRLGIPLAWRVVEQEAFVALGRAEFSDEVLGFDSTVEEAGRNGVDVALFGSSLCYVEHPGNFLGEIERLGVPFLVIDRLPVTAGDRDRIALQEVSEPIYAASYPVRLFGEDRLLGHWLRSWRLIESWNCELSPDQRFMHRGYFLERR